ncbi:phosphatase PAP2 family protein [Streptomyces sp. NPDC008121]|uniref:phosphatase PAP2 family protein n=1 Tax=Streptomyces sp. NPDC008121 TaxID=3364809 RepID=UPI0036E4C704
MSNVSPSAPPSGPSPLSDPTVLSALPAPSDVSGDLYLDILDFAHSTPHWFQQLAEAWTELGLLLFGVLFVAGWWRARAGVSVWTALALLAPLATAFGYVVSESFKSLVDEERPCRTVVGAPASLVPCPPTGDWSFPSNHAAIAGAAAVALALSWRGLGLLTVPMALLMAFSRVFVGVHYPHDVAVGLLLGGAVAYVVVKAATRPVRFLVESARTSRNGAVVWCVGRGPRPHAPTRPEGVRHGAH